MRLAASLTVALCAIARVATAAPPADLEALAAGGSGGAFRVEATYTDAQDHAVGLALTHAATALPVRVVTMDAPPQAMLWFATPVETDAGLPHALEHLLVGRGAKGRALNLMFQMRLGQLAAATEDARTIYHFSSEPGIDSFVEELAALVDALIAPDFSDAEAEREFYHLAVVGADRQHAAVVEQGTVYNEMLSHTGGDGYWRALYRQALGAHHPFAFDAGGVPEAMRGVTPSAIRAYHEARYRLGPGAGLVVVVPRATDLPSLLARIDAILRRAGARHGDAPPSPPVAAAQDHAIASAPYPSGSLGDPATVGLAWSPQVAPRVADRLALEALLGVYASGDGSELARRLGDAVPLVDAGVTDEGTPLAPLPWLTLGGLEGWQATPARAEDLRRQVREGLRAILDAKGGAPSEILVRAQAWAIAARREQRLFAATPPGFGGRATDGSWIDRLALVDAQGGPRRSLSLEGAWRVLLEALAAGHDPWASLPSVRALLAEPYGAIGAPSPSLLAVDEQARSARVTAHVAAARRRLGLAQDVPDERVLERLAEEERAAEVHVEAARGGSALVVAPFLTADDHLPWRRARIAGTRAIEVPLDGTPRRDVVLAFDLTDTPPSLRPYLPLLPSLVRELGARDAQGPTLAPHALDDALARDTLTVEADWPDEDHAGLYELQLLASGTDLDELGRAVDWAGRLLARAPVDETDVPRLRALVASRIAEDVAATQLPEDQWVPELAASFRTQGDPLYLALRARPTIARRDRRLRWQLQDATRDGIAALRRVAQARLDRLAPHTPVEVERSLVAELAQDKLAPLERLLLDDWLWALHQLPPDDWAHGLQQIADEALADLALGRREVLHRLARLLAFALDARHVSVEILCSPSERARVEALAARLIARARAAHTGKRQGAAATNSDEAPIVARMRSRYPLVELTYPMRVGLVADDAMHGSAILDADGLAGSSLSRRDLVGRLAPSVYAGAAARSLYVETWRSGVAYNAGLSVDPSDGSMEYYVDRAPDLRAALAVVEAALAAPVAHADAAVVDQAIAAAFGTSRGGDSPSLRAIAMGEDLRLGLDPAKARRVTHALLSLRRDARLGGELLERAQAALRELAWSHADEELEQRAESLFFFVAPARELDALERSLPSGKLYRLYPSDYWIGD